MMLLLKVAAVLALVTAVVNPVTGTQDGGARLILVAVLLFVAIRVFRPAARRARR